MARKEYLHQRMMEGGLVQPPSTSPLLPGIDDEPGVPRLVLGGGEGDGADGGGPQEGCGVVIAC